MKFIKFVEHQEKSTKIHFIPLESIISFYFDTAELDKIFIKLTSGDSLGGKLIAPNDAPFNDLKMSSTLIDFAYVFNRLIQEI
jgi:hypothetical protein